MKCSNHRDFTSLCKSVQCKQIISNAEGLIDMIITLLRFAGFCLPDFGLSKTNIMLYTITNCVFCSMQFLCHYNAAVSSTDTRRKCYREREIVQTAWHTCHRDVHRTAMLHKASKRIHFLKQLRRVGVSTADLVTYYNSVIRPVLEYAYPVWHSSLTTGQSQEIALRCIVGDLSYVEACSSLGLPFLSDRREQLTKHFFDQLKRPDSCLAHLMPLRRDISLTS